MKKILTLLLFAISLKAYIVKDIEFRGLVHLSQNSAYELLGFEKNSYISPEQINKSIKNLYDRGYFRDISVDYDDSSEKLTYTFEEKRRISRVALKGFLDSDEEKQTEFLEIKKGSLYDEVRVKQIENRILEALNYKGNVDNRVEVTETKLDNGTTQLEFIAREGEEIIIEDLHLIGAESLSHNDIQKSMANREKEGFGWLLGRNSGEMKIKELEIDSARIKEYYMTKGFLDVVVSKPFADIEFNRYTAKVTYKIDEGDVYHVSGTEVEIDTDGIINIDEVMEDFWIERGDRFNIKWFRKDIDILKTAVADKGFAFVNVIPDLERDEKNNLVKIKYKIFVNQKVKIRDVIVADNRLTLDKVVRREVFLAPGDWYNLTDIRDSKMALGRLGYFEKVELVEKKVSETELDLIVIVKEARTGSIQIGGGYSTYLGFTFDAGVSDRNVFGSGIDLGFNLQYSQLSTNYTISVSNPRLFDSLYSGSLSLSHSKFDYGIYEVENNGFAVSIGRRITRHITANLGYSYYKYLYNDVDEEYLDDLESYTKHSIPMSLTFNNTDDYFLPRRGFIISDSVEYAGIAGDAKFIENQLSFNAYKGVEDYIDYDIIFRYKSKLRRMWDTGFIPLNESLHMGGIGSVRGYNPYSFPNRDFEEYQDMKANMSFTHSFEVSLPISSEAKLRWTPFIDYGWLGEDKFDDFHRGGYGIALEWISPMAPIMFVFSRPFNDRAGDEISKFEFTMGRRF
ncbi:outer membrane protein assembly complex, YaeT protein [Thiovulum sp. ES]|nr:outer membrane protein assembly complex, YaeT protein [Thiovulum sp. ES]